MRAKAEDRGRGEASDGGPLIAGTLRNRGAGARLLLRGDTATGNAAWLTLEQVMQLLLGFVVGAIIARHLGVAGFGVLSVAISLSALLAPFWRATQVLVVRDLAGNAAAEPVVLGTATMMHLVATVTAAASVVLTISAVPNLVPPGAAVPTLIVLASVIIRPLMIVDYWFQAHLKARPAVLARSGVVVTMTFWRLVAVVADAPVVAFAVLTAVEAVLTSVATLLAYRRAGGRISGFRVDRRYGLALARESWPILGIGLSVAFYMRIDQAMLGALSGARETGLYSVAVTGSEVILFLPVILFTVAMPGMTRLFECDKDAYAARLQSLFSSAMALAYVAVALAALAGTVLIPLVYGSQYADVVPIFLVLLASVPFVTLGVVQSIWTAHLRLQGLAFIRIATAAVLNLALNFVLLPSFGAMGAAISTVITYAFAALLLNALQPKCRGVLRMQIASLRLHGLPIILRGLNPFVADRDGCKRAH